MNNLTKAILVATILNSSGAVNAGELTVSHYNPASNAIFPVSSSLIAGEHEAVLVDAQFGLNDGNALVKLIKASGKKLTTIYISGGDPDFYFGLEAIIDAFPQVNVIASSQVVAHIQKTKDAKLKIWGPLLAAKAPSKIIVPTIFDKTSFTIEGHRIEVKEINTHQSYLWIPELRTALGGTLVSSGIHLWTADSQTVAERARWLSALDNLASLKPLRVIPGHYIGEIPAGTDAVKFSIEYLKNYEQLLKAKPTSVQLLGKLQQQYPQLVIDEGTRISAKVNTGEMSW
jgi:glyoxylase-like metal-dependent hydrolase (beta-lactamase superfamily II)